MIMKYYSFLIFLSSIIIALTACQNEGENSEYVDIPFKELNPQENTISNDDLLLGMPVRLKYDDFSGHLFIQDLPRWAVIEVDDSSNVVNRFGNQGRGPGEIQMLNDFFVTDQHLFIVDGGQYLIHKYNRQNTDYISSLDFGALLLQDSSSTEGNARLPMPLNDNNNQPFITLNETVLLPSQVGGNFLYRAINWEGEKVADIGKISGECTAAEEENRMAIKNKTVPEKDECFAFPVNDRANPGEIYIVYSAIPKIEKYNLEGQKLWEKQIPLTPEVDSLMADLSNVVSENPDLRIDMLPVRKYVTGRSSQSGDLYLMTYNNLVTSSTPRRPLWIHHFDSTGELLNRYKLNASDDLNYFLGIDDEGSRVFSSIYRGSDIYVFDF